MILKTIILHLVPFLLQKQFFEVVPISATGFLPPEGNAAATPTTTTPGISSGAASTTSPLNTGDVGGGKSGQQVCMFYLCCFFLYAMIHSCYSHLLAAATVKHGVRCTVCSTGCDCYLMYMYSLMSVT